MVTVWVLVVSSSKVDSNVWVEENSAETVTDVLANNPPASTVAETPRVSVNEKVSVCEDPSVCSRVSSVVVPPG